MVKVLDKKGNRKKMTKQQQNQWLSANADYFMQAPYDGIILEKSRNGFGQVSIANACKKSEGAKVK